MSKRKKHKKSDEKQHLANVLLITAIIGLIEKLVDLIASLLN